MWEEAAGTDGAAERGLHGLRQRAPVDAGASSRAADEVVVNRRVIAGMMVAASVGASTFAACSTVDDRNTARGRGDAPVSQPVDNAPKEVIQFPDRFSNVATSCDHHGHRIYVTTKSDQSRFMAVINDEGCPR